MVDAAQPRDDALVTRCLAGDVAAWDLIYDRHHLAIYNFLAQRMRGNPALVDDLFQETMLKIVERLAQFDPGRGALLSWSFGIALNQIRGHGRQLERQSRLLVQVSDTLEDERSPPAHSGETEKWVALACSQLSSRHQTVLEMKYADGRTLVEMADRLGIGAQAVGALLHRARAAFRQTYLRLAKLEPHDG